MTRILPGSVVLVAALTLSELSAGAGAPGGNARVADPPEPVPGKTLRAAKPGLAAARPGLAGVRYAAMLGPAFAAPPSAGSASAGAGGTPIARPEIQPATSLPSLERAEPGFAPALAVVNASTPSGMASNAAVAVAVSVPVSVPVPIPVEIATAAIPPAPPAQSLIPTAAPLDPSLPRAGADTPSLPSAGPPQPLLVVPHPEPATVSASLLAAAALSAAAPADTAPAQRSAARSASGPAAPLADPVGVAPASASVVSAVAVAAETEAPTSGTRSPGRAPASGAMAPAAITPVAAAALPAARAAPAAAAPAAALPARAVSAASKPQPGAFAGRLVTRIDGRTAGSVDFQQTGAGLTVRLGSVAEILGDRLGAAMLARIRSSDAGNAYLSLAELQGQGIPISYDPVYDEFNVGLTDTRPKAARKVHIDQISTPERGAGSVTIGQLPPGR